MVANLIHSRVVKQGTRVNGLLLQYCLDAKICDSLTRRSIGKRFPDGE